MLVMDTEKEEVNTKLLVAFGLLGLVVLFVVNRALRHGLVVL